jgi:hypothetical protein
MMCFHACKIIAKLKQDIVCDGCIMLGHGYFRVVLEVLKLAASNGKLFQVLCAGAVIVTPGLEKVTECIPYVRQDQVPHIQ